MTQANHADPDEPINFVDKRKVDPETGEVRQPTAAENGSAADTPQTEPGPEQAAAEQAAEAAGAAGQGGPGNGEPAGTGDTAMQLAERTADLQRLTAEYANYRRRVERDRKTAIDGAKAAVVTELLGVLDDLDRAKAHGDLETGPLKSVADKLTDALRKQGLEEFGAEGEPFDPSLHEAVQHDGSGHDPVIGLVMRKGYRLGERVLRHALVGVTDGMGEAASAAPEDSSMPGETGASDADAGTNNG
ncbi:nucleotide exchange factor GrpE [Nocardia donostiensis]|uniref:Protein GrpE n=1 Tax=Nocardia donostiensis TaxID=1538463 RepID=A0A1V2TIW8_9NOCA|nr:nucleotide exchange factor GrpE [Nocardia donostiensis]ONM49480.1 nucleotide exchange factor GrpE [Nocardia donostiensis]OQS13541.1 nucleotide exchange factor GrpE [Nocardia donostiensis]OQS19957.1 nucleotide exchange factor GrpE [Nocardia donostiensis]